MPDWTIIRLISWTESYFKDHGVDSPRLSAEILLAHSLDIKRLDLYLQHDRPLEKLELSNFKGLIKRRIQQEPVAYIIGERGFFDSEFKVNPNVLIPRPETELLVEKAIGFIEKENRPSMRVLELGTGSGAVIASIAKACPGHHYFASEVSLAALHTAVDNVRTIVSEAVHFFAGSWLSAVVDQPVFDLIVSNPPYIPTSDIQGLMEEVKNHEPIQALDGGPDGMGCYRKILLQGAGCLVPDGQLMFEIGYDQKSAMMQIVESDPGYKIIGFEKDLAGHDRLVCIEKTD